jgi:hypothetical protein
MELQNGTENRIKELDKNVWGYCINMLMLSRAANFFKSNEQSEQLTSVKGKCQTALSELTALMEKNMDNFVDIKSKIIDFKTKHDDFITVYQSTKKNRYQYSNLFSEVYKLKNSFDKLEKKFIIRYLNYLATQLNGTVLLQTNDLKKGSTYYRLLENYELIKLGVFSYKMSNHSNDRLEEDYNIFGSLKDKIDTEKYYIEVKPEDIIILETPGGNPKKTRRRKNKKRRSSKQQKSKK